MTIAAVGTAVSDAISNAPGEDVLVSSENARAEGALGGTAAELVAAPASDLAAGLVAALPADLPVDLEFGRGGLRLPAVAAPLAAAPGLDFESLLLWSFAGLASESELARNFGSDFGSDFAVVSVATDGVSGSVFAALCIDEASTVPKLEGADDRDMVVLEALGAAAGKGIVFTCIGVPRLRLHSTRQWVKPDFESRKLNGDGAISETYRNRVRRMTRKVGPP